MTRVVLERHDSSDQGTFGRLIVGAFSCFTGELPWRENAPNVSCIPKGTYQATWTYSPRFKRKMFLIAPVIGRTGVRIHSANLMGVKPPYKAQLNGCVALGEKLGWINGQKALLLSAPAVRKFETIAAGRPFLLEVK